MTLEDYKFTLNLPVKITDSNAQNVFNDNHSATWHLYRGSNNTMHVEFDVINPTNIIISVVVFFLIVSFIIILLVVLLNKKPKKTNTTKLAKQNEKHTSSKTYFCGECGTKIKGVLFSWTKRRALTAVSDGAYLSSNPTKFSL